ncbi:B-cell receptor-associated protein 31-like [Mizuhopecten yessoensis]|uniref:B-cell receptor-associated protein 31-like n=1 Tax=Mizuhopecten yessoensis TaxID=6573 RepID=UPI000B459312|nr:B-cell receptor-associated protein 31-like [Mizuhopecten yessoensis]XP_021351961.1 B-cell receptor-associated protein 31-like [Mizuhopecten yessoensis]
MTLQYTFIATFLYIEIAVVILLLLPFVSPARWQKIFRSNIVLSVSGYSYIYFNVFIAILLLLFIDSIREVNKYAVPVAEVDLKHNLDSENLAHMKLFRAQRNLYITGFAMFLWFIIRRLINLTAEQARLSAESEASQKQAKSANDVAKRLMEEQDNKRNKAAEDDTAEEKSLAQQLDKTKEELVKFKQDYKKAKLDLDALRSQAEGTNKEYDRLLKEYSELQKKLGDDGSKKGN